MKTALLLLALLPLPALALPLQGGPASDCAEGPGSTRCEAGALKQELEETLSSIRAVQGRLLHKDSSLSRDQKARLKIAFQRWRDYAEAVCEIRQRAEDSAYSIAWLRCMSTMSSQHLEVIEEMRQLVASEEAEAAREGTEE